MHNSLSWITLRCPPTGESWGKKGLVEQLVICSGMHCEVKISINSQSLGKKAIISVVITNIPKFMRQLIWRRHRLGSLFILLVRKPCDTETNKTNDWTTHPGSTIDRLESINLRMGSACQCQSLLGEIIAPLIQTPPPSSFDLDFGRLNSLWNWRGFCWRAFEYCTRYYFEQKRDNCHAHSTIQCRSFSCCICFFPTT